MGVFDGKIWKGPIGPVSFRGYKNTQVGQSKPGKGKVKQAQTTKTAAGSFGKSGNLARMIQYKFSPLVRGFQDGDMYNRLNSRLAMIFDSARNREDGQFEFNEHSFEMLQGVEFNIESELIASLRVLPKWDYADNELRISLRSFKIPEQLKFPVDVSYCKITFYTLLFDLKASTTVNNPEEFSITLNKLSTTIEAHEFIFDIPDGTLVITGVFLEFYNLSRGFQTLYNNKHFYPASICASIMVPGEFMDKKNRFFEKIRTGKSKK